MALNGQASGGWTESSSALRILHAGIRNSVGILTADSFTQTNPPIVTTAGTVSTNTDTTKFGVLGGSVAFVRPDQGDNYVGGNAEGLADSSLETLVDPVGLFLNNANGNDFENQPGVASGKGPYASGQGTYGCRLFETQALAAIGGSESPLQGDALTYRAGVGLIASRNGYLCPQQVANAAGTALQTADLQTIAAQSEHAASNDSSTVMAVLKMAPDATMTELVFDLRL